MINKKGLGPVVATALLLVVAVVAVTGFQGWFQTFSSSTFSDVETQSSNNLGNTQIETIVGETLYFKNGGKNNITITSIKIDGVDCNVTGNFSNGMNALNISNCVYNITSQTPDIVVITNGGIFQEKVYLKELAVKTIKPIFYLASNGITIKCENANISDTGKVNGITYTAVSNQNLYDKIGSNDLNYYETACTSLVTDMNLGGGTNVGVFYNLIINPNISHWDVSNVIDMDSMFFGASSFNQSLSHWDVSNVIFMDYMFRSASSFNQPLSNFDTSNVIDMRSMFRGTNSFNQPLSNFDTSNVTDMSYMFYGASSFNQSLSNFNTSKVFNMEWMFHSASSFNQPLSNFNTSNVTDMSYMFAFTSSFNQSLSIFNTSKVVNMDWMFASASIFNQNISGWCVNATSLTYNNFDISSGFLGLSTIQPQWGTCP